jgi:hypothetical protein
MLTGYQCEIVAVMGDGGFTCRDCAIAEHGEFTVTDAENGTGCGDLQAVIRYTLDEYASESLWEYLAQEHEGEDLQKAFDEADPEVPCDSCGENLL